MELSGDWAWVNLTQGLFVSELISLSKSSPRPSEVPLTQIPLSDKFFHVLKPLVQTTLFDWIFDLSGIELIRET